MRLLARRAAWTALLGAATFLAPGARADYGLDESLDRWMVEPSAAWDGVAVQEEPSEEAAVAEAESGFFISDPAVQAAQMLPPQAPPVRRPVARRVSAPAAAALAATGLASVPYMIGDSTTGTCVSFSGALDVTLSHPTLACSRLNISEANTALPIDRVYFSYRHFHNATPTRVFQYEENFNIDSFVLAGERTFWDQMCSVEMRLPIENRLNSRLVTNLDEDFPNLFDPLGSTRLSNSLTELKDESIRRVELANISLIFKALVTQRETFSMSGGLGVTLPTARDVVYGSIVNDQVEFPQLGLIADHESATYNTYSNETVYLSPFLAWLYAPQARWYHQGFLQIEVAANPSRVYSTGFGSSTYFDQNGNQVGAEAWDISPFATVDPAEIHPQTLLRLNLGGGYILQDDPGANWLQQSVILGEIHYTSTLQDSVQSPLSSYVITNSGTVPFQTYTVGNPDRRTDIVNAAAGLSAKVGQFVITNAVVAPIRQQERAFDFEYNLQVQRPF